ncbi:MAG: hypothetical protein ACRDRA_21665 [Pseudonocardiaceae bacterium]
MRVLDDHGLLPGLPARGHRAERAETRSIRPTSATAELCACDVQTPRAAFRACARSMNEAISRSCRACAQAITRSQPPIRSNDSNSRCSGPVSAG